MRFSRKTKKCLGSLGFLGKLTCGMERGEPGHFSFSRAPFGTGLEQKQHNVYEHAVQALYFAKLFL